MTSVDQSQEMVYMETCDSLHDLGVRLSRFFLFVEWAHVGPIHVCGGVMSLWILRL